MGNQNKPKGLSRLFHSASDSNLVNDAPGGTAASDSDSQSAQSYQAALSPPTLSRGRRILNSLGWKSSPASGVAPHNAGTGHDHTITSASSSGDHGSPSVTAPVSITVSAPVSTPVSAQTSPQPTSSPAKTDSPAAELPTNPDTVWTKALDIAQNKLSENKLPQLVLTELTSESAEKNMEAVVKSLKVLQQDEQKNKWRYTWRGKEVIIADRLRKILGFVEKYSTVVGAAIQCGPPVGAIVWAGIQGIMRVCI